MLFTFYDLLEVIKYGMIDQFQNMNHNLKNISNDYLKTTKEVQEIAKKIEYEKTKKDNEKEFEKDFKKLMNKVLKYYFIKNYFSRRELNDAYNDLRLTQTRNNIIEYIADNEKEFDYLDEIYEIVLQKTYRIYKNNYDAKEKINQNINNEIKNKTKNDLIYSFITILFTIPILFLILFQKWIFSIIYVFIISIIGNIIILLLKKQ